MTESKSVLLIPILFFAHIAFAQPMMTNKSIAIQQIRDLKTGALVVRLKTNERSIDAYKRSGRTELAARLTDERAKQNQKLVDAFRMNFDYCKVYFILAKNTEAVLQGNQYVFLNDTMGLDTSIHLKEKYFLLAEYGQITSNMRTDEYHYKAVNQTEASASTASTSTIFISDTSLQQLREPFPFYQAVYLDNFSKSVERLNNSLHKAYYKLNDSIKDERKKLREQLKKMRG